MMFFTKSGIHPPRSPEKVNLILVLVLETILNQDKTMNTSQIIPALIFGLILAACVQSNDSAIVSARYESKPDNYPIEIFEVKKIYREHKIIGKIRTPLGRTQSATEAIEKLKQMAREIGGDGLVDLHEESVSGTVELGVGAARYRSRKIYLTARVIVWMQ